MKTILYVITILLIIYSCKSQLIFPFDFKERKSTSLVSKFDSLGKIQVKVEEVDTNYEFELSFINKSKNDTFFIDTTLSLYFNNSCNTSFFNLFEIGQRISNLSRPIEIIKLKPNEKIVKRFRKKTCPMNIEKFEYHITFFRSKIELTNALKGLNRNVNIDFNQEVIYIPSDVYAIYSTSIGMHFYKKEKQWFKD